MSDYKSLDAAYYMPAFSRTMMIARGKGCTVWDVEGNEYLDLVAGIAVCSTGHCHDHVVDAICAQAHDLIHCSNLYYVPGQAEFAKRLANATGLAKVFCSNSGAEANDAAIKLARIATKRDRIVSFTHGFHGRTLGSLAVTHKPAIREPFGPLEPKCTFVEYGDFDGLRAAVTEETAAVILEPIQGEAGVIIPPEGFIESVREISDDKGALLIADEIQTGMGRTGTWLAMHQTKVMPDIVSLAKGLGSGFPVGAIAAREDLAFNKGEHGSTFAGGPLAMAASMATMDVVEPLLPGIPGKGELFAEGLAAWNPRVRGLMIGITVGSECPKVQQLCAERGVLVNCAGDGNLRLVPPLIISSDEIARGVSVINEVLREVLG
ncbi:MAG: acetylornithine/succinylornithine family transaminase [Methanocalculus sp. MSAO_Arc1]|uniref:aspartate aminotransferase family protein n=1 Tax=Methanocalculus TaxID=71151 RepID=UPI000FEEAB58|nr:MULTISPECIES: acetylornithine/succinylornithine family transaminase [unclassified Methanocalculus]MCP1662165.1 acetylornithine/N-succinyldiaminopimelate aminotransferase [Methanocalculus sp. AMF5]RQD79104.1 MAG: acetylornithine/succinylornithine family transaminase [Methanocalculus sp. MSAO_Arc1]